MFERFTDRARKTMALANQQAQQFNHEGGIAAQVFKNMDIDLRKIRLEVEKLINPGPDMITMGKLPQTPGSKRVIERAINQSRSLGHNYIGTEHLLLGLTEEPEGIAHQVLATLGITTDRVRQEVVDLVHGTRDEADDAPPVYKYSVLISTPLEVAEFNSVQEKILAELVKIRQLLEKTTVQA